MSNVADIAQSLATTREDRIRWEINRALNACESHCRTEVARLRANRDLRANVRSHDAYGRAAHLMLGSILIAASVVEQVETW